MRLNSAISLGIVVLLVAGCSGSVGIGEDVLYKADVEHDSAIALANSTGLPVPDVSCPDDLEAKVGATERCTLTDSKGNTLGVTVTVKSLGPDNTANYEAVVDSK